MNTATLEDVLKKVKIYKPKANLKKIREAYEIAKKLHSGEKRASGQLYSDFLVDVADILTMLKPDEDTMVASFLQKIARENMISMEDLKKDFGKNVHDMLDSIRNLEIMRTHVKESNAETMRKMFLAIAKDLRVVLLRLARRLVSMRTLEHVEPRKRKEIARETLDVFVPVASRLGIYNIKSELEDLAFKYLYPDQYENIAEQIEEIVKVQSVIIDDIKKELVKFLDEQGVKAKVDGRLKNISSIYRKLKRKNKTTIDEVFDIFAMRIILPTEFQGSLESYDHIYSLLGIIHSKWVPLADRFKDYVAVPKSNGYQSLHTTVLGLAPKEYDRPVEIQIRSDRMHTEAEFGIASHWLYEDTAGKSTGFDRDTFSKYISSKEKALGKTADENRYKRQLDWLKGLKKLQEDLGEGKDTEEDFNVDIFGDRIFVLTPHGEVKDLPAGSTPIDFAYAVHTDIGHRCAMAKVNGSVVSLDCELENGSVVEIVLKPKPNPKPHWLSFVKTSGAQTKIKAWFRTFDKDRNIREGKEFLNKNLKKYDKPPLDDSYSILKNYAGKKRSLREREGILEEIGNGAQLANVVVKKLYTPDELSYQRETKIKVPKERKDSDGILVGGEGGLPLKIASCCKPSQGSDIIAYITKGHEISIHRKNCPHVTKLDETRLLESTWGSSQKEPIVKYRVKFSIEMVNRVGLLRDITSVIASFDASIVNFEIKSQSGNVITRSVTLEVLDLDQFDKILDKLERVQNVLRVERKL
ncbi:MAG: RelA/SpoT family protein [Patescibacteria group bacterium]|nr:RelA/SpoT family protein [Patescibacteria group bacterium]